MRHTRGTTLTVAAAAGLCVVHDRMRHSRSNDARAPCASARAPRRIITPTRTQTPTSHTQHRIDDVDVGAQGVANFPNGYY